MRFRRLYCEDFQPFGELDLRFPAVEHPQRGGEVHILTGVNGTGKTRLLAVLAAMLGNSEALKARVGGDQKPYYVEITDDHGGLRGNQIFPPPSPEVEMRPPLFVYGWRGSEFGWGPGPVNRESIPACSYSGDAYLLGTTVQGSMEAVPVPDRVAMLDVRKPESASKRLSQALYNLTIMGANDIRTFDSLSLAKEKSRPLRLLSRIEATLQELTGRKLSFRPVPTPTTRLLVAWGSTEALPFELLPDGLRSVLGWLVDLAVTMDLHYPDKAEPWNQPLIVLLDEVERHLHPAWQRKILPIAQKLFPQAQFFVATHSPFIISSLNEGWIHHLELGENGRVTVDAPMAAAEGDSYVSVMASIMGVTELYDPETESLLQNYRDLRAAAMRREAGKREEAIILSEKIAQRGPELAYMMQKERNQLAALLNGSL